MSNLSVEDFNANFSTKINKFMKENDQVCCTGFKIVCTPNNRKFYMQTCVETLSPDLTETQIVDAGWSNLLPHVKTWAGEIISASNIVDIPFTPSNISLSNYTEKFDTIINKLDTYPENSPYCWCVAFNSVYKENPMYTKYVDTQVRVDMEQYTSEETIMNIGWDQVKGQIESWASDVMNTPTLLNTMYSTSNW
jgi:hypothetical protein